MVLSGEERLRNFDYLHKRHEMPWRGAFWEGKDALEVARRKGETPFGAACVG